MIEDKETGNAADKHGPDVSENILKSTWADGLASVKLRTNIRISLELAETM